MAMGWVDIWVDFALNFYDLISSLFDTFINMISNIELVVDYIENVRNTAFEFIATLPDFLQVFAIGTVLITILFQLLRFQTGGVKSGS